MLYSFSFLTTVHLDTGKSNKGLYVYMFKVFFDENRALENDTSF